MMQARDLERLIIFPLPNVVLLPHAELPLHMFEPRYRQMTRDAVEQGRLIAMATMDPQGEAREDGQPAILPLMGVGELAECKELPDGRFYVVLKGVGRARILEEHSSQAPYREVRAEELPDVMGDELSTQRSMEAVRGMMLSMRVRNPRLATLLHEELRLYPEPAVFSNRLAGMMRSDIEAQYKTLETRSVPERMEAIVEQISGFLARSSNIPGRDLN